MHNNPLIENFNGYVERHALFTHEDKILLTVSGGVDSMVMLSLFAASGYNIGVAHCNFGLRGAESDEDEVVVAREAAKYGVECYNKRFDTVGEMERTGESMEMAARRLRYAWFYELCDAHGYNVIAVAHHADDSIETFFINLLRGTGLKGLTGINHQMGRVVRPLMFASRKELLEYAVANRIPFREDSSNRSTKYLRNKIRLGLIPMIREINPKFTSLMRGNLYRLTDAQQFIETAVGKIRETVTESRDGVDTIDIGKIDAAFPRNFVIYTLLNSAYGFKGDVVDELCRALSQGQTGKRFYSREYVACVDRGNIVVMRIADNDGCETAVEQGAIRSYCGNSVLYYEHTDIDNITDYSTPQDVALIDEDKLKYPLCLRRWRDGDSFVPFGMNGRKKVSDFLIDHKVSVVEKSRQFVLVSGNDIVWLVGRRIDDRYRITATTEKILKIYRETI
ncbi:MAG: tRNA lysidine(34) synthetase TilS [Alistipes sp.]